MSTTRPQVPAISVDTTTTPQLSTEHDPSRLSVAEPSSPKTLAESSRSRSASGSSLSPSTPVNNLLSVSNKPPRSPTSSISGETLRPISSSQKEHYDDVPLSDALEPDPGTEGDFRRDNNPFAFTPGQFNKQFNPKSLAAFTALGGLAGIAAGLKTNVKEGLSADETTIQEPITFNEATRTSKSLEKNPGHSAHLDSSASGDKYGDRLRIFGANKLPEKKPTSLLRLIWNAYTDKILILLSVAAVVSLALGIYETVGKKHTEEDAAEQGKGGVKGADWIEGVAIIVAILIVVLVGALNDYQKEKQFVKLNRKKESREVKVIRSGKSQQISIYDILVGDVMYLEPGDMIPADGVFIQGHNVKCDESSATGESDQMKKTPGDEVMKKIEEGTATKKLDPFIISGSKVLEGVGTFMVTSVGENSSFGKIMMGLRTEAEPTPLQNKLNGLASAIAKLGSAAAALLFFVLLFRFLAQLPTDHRSPAAKASVFTDILIVAVTIVVVAVPEGLPLAVTLALAFATTRMIKENNLVRILKSCEIMGNATTICSDKTGTLTQNKMTVVAGTIGVDSNFASPNHQEIANGLPTGQAVGTWSDNTRNIVLQGIVQNSTAFEGEENGVATFIGSKTETALLTFARDFLGMRPVAEERSDANVVQLIPFDSGRKCMGVVIKLASGAHRLYIKGASEIMLAHATHYLPETSNTSTETIAMTEKDRQKMNDTITSYAQHSLRTIGMLYRDLGEQWPPVDAVSDEDSSSANFDVIFKNMTFIGLVGIQDPLRDGVIEAVADCKRAGVKVRMVTGDNVTTATAIAIQCGIKSEGGLVLEGPKFRQLPPHKMDELLPRLEVLARSSPEDKKILVQRLKHLGETVAVTGDGTNDGPALKAADVGFSMGIAGTEVAKEASAIILMDDNFASIVIAIMWGRAVNDAVRKFLQFQLTVNITAVLLAFVSAVSNPGMHSVLTAVQLLWVNLIMDTFAALALATDAPTRSILNRKPTPKRSHLISLNMWKMIIGQAIFQLTVTFILYFAGPAIFHAILGHHLSDAVLDTMVFNTFVWMQIFNEFNNRRLDNKFNIFEGMFHNYFFLGINCVMIGGQILIIFVGGSAFSITRINGWQWGVCLVLAALCLPWAIVVRLIPDEKVLQFWMGVMPLFRFIGKGWTMFKKVLPQPKFMKKRSEKKKAKRDAKRGITEKITEPLEDEDYEEFQMANAPEITVSEGNHTKSIIHHQTDDLESGLTVPEQAVVKSSPSSL